MVSEPAPEAPASPSSSSAPGIPPAKHDNVFTRKIGPLPMWVWLAIAALLILIYVVYESTKKGKGSGSSSSSKGKGKGSRGFGRWLRPHVPHIHHHRGGDHQRNGPAAGTDQAATDLQANMRRQTEPKPNTGAARQDITPLDRRDKRGMPFPGWLVEFKTADKGQTPSLQNVANAYNTDPEAVVQTAEGRGYPTSASWKRYVSRHDWLAPLPPSTNLSIIAHPD